jgi:hypothetical protein
LLPGAELRRTPNVANTGTQRKGRAGFYQGVAKHDPPKLSKRYRSFHAISRSVRSSKRMEQNAHI